MAVINNQEEALNVLRGFLKSRDLEEFEMVRSFEPIKPMGTCYRFKFRGSENGSEIFLRIYESGYIEKEGRRWSDLFLNVCPPHVPESFGHADRVYHDQGSYWAEYLCKFCGEKFEVQVPNLVGQ